MSVLFDTKAPSFNDYRSRNNAAMVPDRGFTKQLKALDPELEVVWDWGSSRWEIWRFASGQEPHHVLTVQTKERTYRELGADILLKLQAGDTKRYGTKALLSYLEEMDKQVQRRKERAFRNKIDSIAKDTHGYIHIVQGQVPKSYLINETQEQKVRRVLTDG